MTVCWMTDCWMIVECPNLMKLSKWLFPISPPGQVTDLLRYVFCSSIQPQHAVICLPFFLVWHHVGQSRFSSFQHDWWHIEVPLQPCSLHVTSSLHAFTISELTNFFRKFFQSLYFFSFLKTNSYIDLFWWFWSQLNSP